MACFSGKACDAQVVKPISSAKPRAICRGDPTKTSPHTTSPNQRATRRANSFMSARACFLAHAKDIVNHKRERETKCWPKTVPQALASTAYCGNAGQVSEKRDSIASVERLSDDSV